MVPDGWKVVSIKHISSFIGSGITPKGGQKIYKKTGIPLIRSQNVHFGGLRLDDVAYITEEIHATMERTRLCAGDVLLNITGASIGRCSYIPENFGEGNVNQHVCIIRCFTEIAFYQYINFFLESVNGQKQIQALQAGLSREALNYQQVKEIKITLPPLHEQKKIAAILSSVDEANASTQAVIDQTRKVKQGLLQQLLTKGIGHTRFKESAIGEIPKAWEVLKIGDLLDSSVYGISKNLSDDDTGVPVLRMGNIQDNRLDFTSLKYANLSNENQENVLLKSGDILFNRTNSKDLVGKVALVKEDRPLSFASYLIRLRTNCKAKPEWLFRRLAANDMQSLLRSIATPGVSQVNINPTRMRELLVAVPPLNEQLAIAKVGEDFDNALESYETKLHQIVKIKRGLMQDLLTGRIRVGGTP